MTAIFISYRRQDTKQIAGRIFDKFTAKFGAGSVFMDTEGIPFGVNFHTFLDEAVARARIVLVLIGPGWADAKDEAGRRRLDSPDDFVRIEVESALRRKIPMGAVLIDGAPVPRAEQLPESMRALLRFNAAPVDAGRDFHVHMDRLIADLEKHLNGGFAPTPQVPDVPATVARPAWPSGAGQDKSGRWADFALGGVTQRMRWIEPGSFLMGSPPDEPGRYKDEVPQHEVRLSQGYWLADTPVTQALWTAAMGSNPSHFKDPKRPVEQVSWDHAQQFLQKIGALVPGLDLVLPTEAQWEYACRAGTRTATYAGAMEILGDGKLPALDRIAWYVPVLEEIAWYGGNSGACTHPVAQKLPNAWGLYDMLGNVLEWCADGRRSYSAKPVTDPAGPLDNDFRMQRGSYWESAGWRVRAAYRHADQRNCGNQYMGFRCASVRRRGEVSERCS